MYVYVIVCMCVFMYICSIIGVSALYVNAGNAVQADDHMYVCVYVCM